MCVCLFRHFHRHFLQSDPHLENNRLRQTDGLQEFTINLIVFYDVIRLTSPKEAIPLQQAESPQYK